ncbi:hypothetical protein ACVWXM_009761 [Bradyrhizobium sp. GM7.3]
MPVVLFCDVLSISRQVRLQKSEHLFNPSQLAWALKSERGFEE